MILTQEQLEAVRLYFQNQQMSHTALEDDLVDHCCSGIEDLMDAGGHDFDLAFALTRQRLVPNGAKEIEEDLKYLENYKPQRTMKKFVFASGYVSALCMLAGVVLIAMSLFQKQNVQLSREQLEVEARFYTSSVYEGENGNSMANDLYKAHAAESLLNKKEIRTKFLMGQQLMLLAIVLFAITLLPYQFYKRYQRSLVEYANP